MIAITINSQQIRLKGPCSVLKAARDNNIDIPHFCNHPMLEKYGGCRMCLVEIERMPRLQTACTVTATDGMVVTTESEAISEARRAVLEFQLINHPLDCPTCDKAGECKLQDYVVKYGPAIGRFKEEKIKHAENIDDPLIVRNPERCISCTRCVRMCGGVQGASAIAMMGRGNHTTVEPFSGGSFDCEYCGNCLSVCPVGSIMSRLHRYSYRPWQMQGAVRTVCSFCGVGCNMTLQVRDNKVVRTTPELGTGFNKGLLCSRGRFGYGYTSSKEALTGPLVRKNGTLQPATWEEALSLAARKLKQAAASGAKSSGIPATGALASPRCTNEDNYLLSKLMRAALGSNNIDSIARMGYAGARRLLDSMLGPAVTSNPIAGILDSGAVLVIGDDPTKVNPVLGVHVRMAQRQGAKVLTLGHTPGLREQTTLGLMPTPGSEAALLGAIVAEILSEGKDLPGTNQALEAKLKALKMPSSKEGSKASGLKPKAIKEFAQALSSSSPVSIVIGRDASASPTVLTLVAAVAYALNGRIYIMSERPNEQGLMDMGCLPDTLPGGAPLLDQAARARIKEAWGADITLPEEAGLTLMEMVEAAHSGSLSAMYIMGENPAFNLPDSAFVTEALGKLDFLVVQDMFLTETAELAHVVLPSSGWAGREGTFTNLERRVQRLRKAVTGEGREDWRIISELGEKMGLKMPYSSAADVMKEISAVSPLYAGITEEALSQGGSLWPYGTEPEAPAFSFPETPEIPTPSNGGLNLKIEKPLFHSGTLSRMSPGLNAIYPEALALISPEAAAGLSIIDGETVEVSSQKGSITLKVKIENHVPEDIVLLTNNFKGQGAMALVGYALEPLTKAPILQGKDVSIKKI